MGVEKEGTKSGYVGGFFHLFDWTSKSRKKLFASKSGSPGTYTACIEHVTIVLLLFIYLLSIVILL